MTFDVKKNVARMKLSKKRITIMVCATESYCYAINSQADSILMALDYAKIKADIIFVGDKSQGFLKAQEKFISSGHKVHLVIDKNFTNNEKNYDTHQQLTIAQMRQTAVVEALSFENKYALFFDSDVLPSHNSIKSMIDTLKFDSGYYSISFCPYLSQGGGDILGGFGDHKEAIYKNIHDNEKKFNPKIKRIEKKFNARAKKGKIINENWIKALNKAKEETQANGNVFDLNAKGYRKRGWFNWAYAGIGKGSIVPTDWSGMGCTMMNRKALTLCNWIGYEGKGTEDLYINHERWGLHGLKIGLVAHSPADHILRSVFVSGKMRKVLEKIYRLARAKKKIKKWWIDVLNNEAEKLEKAGKLKFVHAQIFHERDGEFKDHIRTKNKPFLTHEAGEKWEPENDGILINKLPNGNAFDIKQFVRIEKK